MYNAARSYNRKLGCKTARLLLDRRWQSSDLMKLHKAVRCAQPSKSVHCNVRFGSSKAALTAPKSNFRFTPESGLRSDIAPCPKSANLGSRGHHSITLSARTSSDDGTVNPSAWAVLRLIANWYFVRACAGRLAGFSPLKMYRIEALLQDNFDDHRIDGYHSSYIHSLGIRGRALAYGD